MGFSNAGAWRVFVCCRLPRAVVPPGRIALSGTYSGISQPAIAAQVLYWCYDDPTYRVNGGVPGDPANVLTECVDSAVTYGVTYLEIHQKDVLDLPSVVSYARSGLGRDAARSCPRLARRK